MNRLPLTTDITNRSTTQLLSNEDQTERDPTESSAPSRTLRNGRYSPDPTVFRHQLKCQAGPLSNPLPYNNNCDKDSISEIHCEVESLNSSIGDVVDWVIEKYLYRRCVHMRDGIESHQITTVIEVVWQHRETRDKQIQRRIHDALLHGLITDFIHDVVMGNRMDRISQDYKHFCQTSTRVEVKEPFLEAQNWKRIAATLFDHPPPETWDALGKDLVSYIEGGFWPILGESSKGSIRIFKDPHDSGRFSFLIHSAYNLMLKIHGGILSERLELTIAEKNKEILGSGTTNMLQVVGFEPDEQFPGFGRQVFVLGIRGFGLESKLENGSKRIYIKNPVTAGKPKNVPSSSCVYARLDES